MDYVKYSLIALVGWGIWSIGIKMLTRHFNALSVAFWISFFSILFLSSYIVLKKDLMFNRYTWFAIPIGVISLIAIVAFYKALDTGPISIVAPLTNMYVIFPVLFGFIFLKETITLTRIFGIIFAILATVFLSL